MTPETKLFGIPVGDLSDVVLEQMRDEADLKAKITVFVINATSHMISAVTNDESRFLSALELPRHTGTEILRVVVPEIDRRLKGRRVLAELLRKIGDNSATAVEAAWEKAETERRTLGPREVPNRMALRFGS